MRSTTVMLITLSSVGRVSSYVPSSLSKRTRWTSPSWIGKRRQTSIASVQEDGRQTQTFSTSEDPFASIESTYDNRFSVISTVEDVKEFKEGKKVFQNNKFRQHVNPLSRKFQMPCHLPSTWPRHAFHDCSQPLFLDIGCGKGGFLLDLAQQAQQDSSHPFRGHNFLGLEIRPPVAEYAAMRLPRRQSLQGKVSFVGCNVNVDLKRLLDLYTQGNMILDTVSIQYPDPLFKERHKKRKVVTQDVISTLAEYMAPQTTVFLQSDIQIVLDDMRQSFREENGLKYFVDEIESMEEYMEHNPIGLPTEREVSVLEKGLPVFRTVFRRNDLAVDSKP